MTAPHASTHQRRLLIVRADRTVAEQHLPAWMDRLSRDWICVSPHPFEPYLTIQQSRQLLGQTFSHALFDATTAFSLDQLAMLAGTLQAGSVLILLLPSTFDGWVDADSLRWDQCPTPKAVPHFIDHLERTLQCTAMQYPQTFYQIRWDREPNAAVIDAICSFFTPTECSLSVDWIDKQHAQQSLLQTLRNDPHRILLLTGERGRGKSAIAGQLSIGASAYLTAPNRRSVTTFLAFNPNISFIAPDALLQKIAAGDSLPDQLFIDEVAMLPLAMTHQLIEAPWQKVVMTTTTAGYEGSGQGVLHKLAIDPSQSAHYQLQDRFRWSDHDAIEFFVDHLTLSESVLSSQEVDHTKTLSGIVCLQITEAMRSHISIAPYWALLRSAHYQTTLSDLRRLWDGSSQYLYAAQAIVKESEERSIQSTIDAIELQKQKEPIVPNEYVDDLAGTRPSKQPPLLAVLLVLEEGSLPLELVHAIRQGERRPQGNLVVQSLAAHSGCLEAAQWRSLRIQRIAVVPSQRRQKIATQLIDFCRSQSNDYDFLSVSFSYNEAILHFWQSLGFQLVQVGSRHDPASGEPALMAICPISDRAQSLVSKLSVQCQRNRYYWAQWLKKPQLSQCDFAEAVLWRSQDEQLISLFATTSFAYSGALPSLFRLYHRLCDLNTQDRSAEFPCLSALVAQNDPWQSHTALSFSRRQWVQKLRLEAAHALHYVNS